MESHQKDHRHTNSLIQETSPYLLQHAHNPVDWYAWSDETLMRAKELNKPLLISIGYSACHWCHVMEGESFENDAVAAIMNAYFICIKVDKEERPDVDQLYMSAAQLITGSGGWPLNCFAFPDGRPFYAGTYFTKENWLRLLETINNEWETNRLKLEDYASKLLKGIKESSYISSVSGFVSNNKLINSQIDKSVAKWSEQFDHENGGMKKAPKFPLPNNYLFLLRYAEIRDNDPLKQHVHLTLKKMARGGIYDQLAGGFARYSVDALWKVPHFEKMLYDNMQLLELYSEAYRATNDREYLILIQDTAKFMINDFQNNQNLFYSALDADSEGVEGKFYVWTKDELEEVLGPLYKTAEVYFGIGSRGYWEDDNNILVRQSEQESIDELNSTIHILHMEVEDIKARLLDVRQKRTKPGLDDKCLTSWNGFAISAYCSVYKTAGVDDYKRSALLTAEAILKYQLKKDYSLFHSFKKRKSTIQGFLEDYASIIAGFLDVYHIEYDTKWLIHARNLLEYTLDNFYDDEQGMFVFTPHHQKDLVVRQVDYFDNVIPSSNSMMCRNLLRMSKIFNNIKYRSIALEMIDKIAPRIENYGSGFSNWMIAMLEAFGNYKEVVIVGDNAFDLASDINKSGYSPEITVFASKNSNELSIFEGRYVKDKTLIYVCKGSQCHTPVDSVEKALTIIKE